MSDEILKRDIDLCMGRVEDLGKRISRLEKTVLKMCSLETSTRMQNEIAELREKLGNHYHGDVGIWFDPDDYKGVKEQLNKLQAYYKVIADCDPCRNKEILQELIDILRGHYINDHNHTTTTVLSEEATLIKLLTKLSGETEKKELEMLKKFTFDNWKPKKASGGEKEFIGCCYCFHNTCKEEPCNSCFEYDKFETDSKPPEPSLEEKFIKTISNPKLHWYYKTPKGEGFLDEPREDDSL